MLLVSSCSCLCTIYWSQVLSRQWGCSWSSVDRRCSNYIWMINNFIAYQGASCIRGLTVVLPECSSFSTRRVKFLQGIDIDVGREMMKLKHMLSISTISYHSRHNTQNDFHVQQDSPDGRMSNCIVNGLTCSRHSADLCIWSFWYWL